MVSLRQLLFNSFEGLGIDNNNRVAFSIKSSRCLVACCSYLTMESSKVFAITLACLLVITSQVAATAELCIVNDNSDQNCTDYNCTSCATLDSLAENCTSNSNVKFLSRKYRLNEKLELRHLSNVHLYGHNKKAVVECSGNGSGFVFDNVTDAKLTSLEFVGCGAFYNEHVRASLYFCGGADLTLINITITRGVDAGIIASNVRGKTLLSHLSVSNTTSTKLQRFGNAIKYFDCRNDTDTSYQLIVQDSNFTDNHGHSVSKVIQASGLAVYISMCYARINITRTRFVNNSAKNYGGNLAIVFRNITDISAQYCNISDVLIESGRAKGGGGLYIFITKYTNTSGLQQIDYTNRTHRYKFNTSATVIENVTFRSNMATTVGAAIYVQLKASTQEAIVHHHILVKNCTFHNNSLTSPTNAGIAVYINYFDIDGYLFQVNPQYKITVSNSYFQDHYVHNNRSRRSQRATGNSVVFVNYIIYFKIEDVTITNNAVNAITAINSNIIFKGNTTLSHNNGSSGGGLLLCQNSVIYLTENTTIWIFNNTVTHAGGGICVEPYCIKAVPQCFFQIDNELKNDTEKLKTVHVHIFNNTASYGGHNLFGGDVDLCFMTDSPERNQAPLTSLKVYETVFNISNGLSSVTSEPRHICFCKHGVMSCDRNNRAIAAYPGQEFVIKAVIVGQLNGSVPGVVQTWLMANSTHEDHFNGAVQNISHRCSKLNYTIYTSGHNHKVHLKIGVQHIGDQSGYERLRDFKPKRVTVKIKDCPVGFTLQSDTSVARNMTCNNCVLPYKELECYTYADDDVFIRRKALGNAWLGFDYDSTDSEPTSIKHNENCPFDYCTDEEKLDLYIMRSRNNNLCANYRFGIGCGGCQNNYSAMLGSSKCGLCTNHYLALIVAFALAGVALVVTLTVLNLTIAEGTLSGLIFYANVIETNISFLAPHKKYHSFPTPLLRVFIAWINLDLGIPTCFYNGMDAYAEAWLEFAFPLYMWGIAITIIVLSRRFQWIATIASKNAVKVLATLVLLSYTTFTHSSIRTFSYITIHTLYKNLSSTTETAWLIDPNIPYFGPKHALLFAVGILFGLVTLPFMLVLLFIKPLQKFSHKSLLKWLERLKPFIDAFTGPYTDSGRFWPGMLLLARICLSITGGLNTLSAKRVVQNVTSLVIIALLGAAGLVRPGLYRSRFLDALEYFFLFNLAALLVGVTYYDGSVSHQEAVFDVSAGLAFFIFIAIVVYHASLKWTSLATLFRSLTTERKMITNFHPDPLVNESSEEREPLLAVMTYAR